MRRRPTLLRSAVVTVVAGGALLIPAAAFAQDGAPAPHRAEAAAPEQPSAGSDLVRADPYYLAAGGAMAAAGAAGLVYSTVRRGRTED
jgi:hypothetical protein